MLQHGLELPDHRLQRRAGAKDGDIWLGGLDRLADVRHHLDAQLASELDDVTRITASLGLVDVDGTDELIPLAIDHLPRDGGADWTKPDQQDANVHRWIMTQ